MADSFFFCFFDLPVVSTKMAEAPPLPLDVLDFLPLALLGATLTVGASVTGAVVGASVMGALVGWGLVVGAKVSSSSSLLLLLLPALDLDFLPALPSSSSSSPFLPLLPLPSVGFAVGLTVGILVGAWETLGALERVGVLEGAALGSPVGLLEGDALGSIVGALEMVGATETVGDWVGGGTVGVAVFLPPLPPLDLELLLLLPPLDSMVDSTVGSVVAGTIVATGASVIVTGETVGCPMAMGEVVGASVSSAEGACDTEGACDGACDNTWEGLCDGDDEASFCPRDSARMESSVKKRLMV